MDLTEKVAEAMKAKRAELIAQPLSRVWTELAEVAQAICVQAFADEAHDHAEGFEHLRLAAINDKDRDAAISHGSGRQAVLSLASAIRSMGEKGAPVKNGDTGEGGGPCPS